MPYKDPTSGDLARYLTIRQAAEKIGLSYQVVLRMVQREQLPSARVGGRHFIAPEALEALLPPKSKPVAPHETEAPDKAKD